MSVFNYFFDVLNILVFDSDTTHWTEMNKTFVACECCKIDKADTYEEFEEKFKLSNYDLILVHVNKDGREFSEFKKMLTDFRNTPVIYIVDEGKQIIDGYDNGGFDVIYGDSNVLKARLKIDLFLKKLIETNKTCFCDVGNKMDLFRVQKMDLISNLMNGLAHDLKNTLMLFSGYISLLESDIIDNVCAECVKHLETDEYLSTIRKILVSTEELLNRMIGFSKGDWKEKMTFVEVDKVMNNKVKPLLTMIHNKIDFNLHSDAVVFGNERVLTQMMINLVVNSDRAINRRDGLIKVETSRDDDMLCIIVSDNGEGITASDKDKIFEPYFTRNGTGLGLFMVWEAVKLHGGEIKVDSDLGIGTTMRVLIPCS